jgi:hypothetical protein
MENEFHGGFLCEMGVLKILMACLRGALSCLSLGDQTLMKTAFPLALLMAVALEALFGALWVAQKVSAMALEVLFGAL